MTYPVPDRPFQRVGADLFDCHGKSHIVVTNYFSNYPEVVTLQTTSSKAVIAFLKTVFARHGVPCELVSDNGLQFASSEFADFAKEWGFQHTTSSPHYPRSSGLAESSVKVVKGLMKKSTRWKGRLSSKSDDLLKCTTSERPITSSDADGTVHTHTNLPIHEDLLTPKGDTQSQSDQNKRQTETKTATR